MCHHVALTSEYIVSNVSGVGSGWHIRQRILATSVEINKEGTRCLEDNDEVVAAIDKMH